MTLVNNKTKHSLLALCLFTLLNLTACGSGGGGSSSTPAPQPIPQPVPVPVPEPIPEPEPQPVPTPELEIPAGGTAIITPTPATNYNFWAGDNNGPVASAEVVAVTHPEFSQAVRVTVTNPSGEFWNGQVQYPTTATINNGDTMLIRVFFRSISTLDETGAGFVTTFIENPEFTKYVQREITSTGDWQEYFIPVQITANEAAGALILKFGFGAGNKAQTFEIGGVQLLNYGTSKTIAQLPQTIQAYDGREADAEWRVAAAARIEQHRKGDFVVRVTGDNDAPVANATVTVEFKKHAYHFGSVTVGHLIMGNSPDSEKYRQTVLEMFNQSGPENDLKWGPWAGEWGSNFSQATTVNALEWLHDQGLYLRGHVLVWPSKRNLPNLMQDYLPDDPANANPVAKQVVLDHIDDITSATEHVLSEWDVLNEPYDNHYLMDAFGNSVMLDWFAQARNNLPEHKLYINDYSILSAGGRDFAHQQHYEDTIAYLVENNAAIDGIGMQSHFSNSPTSITRVYDILERFHTHFPTLAIRSTEFDIDTLDEELQADYTRDFMTIFFSHPATVGIQNWGFWAGAHWRANAAYYTQDWREKPNAVAWKNLIYNTWWNDFSGTSNSAGEFSARGFYGTYEVTVTQGNNSRHCTIEITKTGDNTFTLPMSGSAIDGACFD